MLRLTCLLLAMACAAPALAQGMGHGHGGHGAGHDMQRMPGLQGENASQRESDELFVMFRHFDRITREVEYLPNGIRTVTRTRHPHVLMALQSHVAGMTARVTAGDDPRILIQSPTLDIFFARGDEITADIEMLDDGIAVLRTATDPQLVAALHTHAAEVSAMVDRGMEAVHEMMEARAARPGQTD